MDCFHKRDNLQDSKCRQLFSQNMIKLVWEKHVVKKRRATLIQIALGYCCQMLLTMNIKDMNVIKDKAQQQNLIQHFLKALKFKLKMGLNHIELKIYHYRFWFKKIN